MSTSPFLAADRIKLNPVVPPLGDPANARQEESLMILRKHVIDWGTDYAVKDANGEVVVVANAKPASTLDKKQILDGEGKALYILKDVISVHKTIEGKAGHHHIFQVENYKTQKGDDHETTLTGWWEDKRGNHKFAVKGNWWKGEAVIWLVAENQPIGAVVVYGTNESGMWSKEEYAVRVAPGVDLQVFAGICIAAEFIVTKELE